MAIGIVEGTSGADIIDPAYNGDPEGERPTDGADIIDGSSGEDVILAGAGNDAIAGGLGDDVILGEDGDDAVNGGDGDDTAFLGAGDDRFTWNPGDDNDVVEGQDGNDTLDFNGAGANEIITIQANGGRVLFTRNVANVVMDLNDVERIEFDALGGVDDIVVNDLSGTDVTQVAINLAAVGGGGDFQLDTVIVQATNGGDQIIITMAGTAVTVNGLPAQVAIDGSDPIDRLIINGLAGDDTITAPTVELNAIALTIDGGSGNDTIGGGDGGDFLTGGADIDTVTYAASFAGVNVNLVGGFGTGGGAQGDVLSGFENLVGSAFADTLTGDGLANTLSGGAGNDTMAGGGGVDILLGEDGDDAVNGGDGSDVAFLGAGDDTFTWNPGDDNDTVEGQDGNDTLDFNGAGADEIITVTPNGERVILFRDVAAVIMDLNGVERLVIDGFDGNDVIDGSAILAGSVSFVMEGGAGADTLSGGGGVDTASYTTSLLGVNVNLGNGSGSGGDAEGDILSGIENLTGSAFADTLTGDGGANVLTGGLGDDALNGLGGDDTLDGSSGADLMQGGTGSDTYVVDDPGDVVDEAAAGSDGVDTVLASLSFALADGVENLTLTGSADINGTGNGLANAIAGNSAANLLDGGLGNDVLTGGAGGDSFVFSAALNKKTNLDTITDYSVAEDTILLDNAIFAKLKDGVLKGKFFEVGKKADDGNDFIVYNKKTGVLTYDKNGDDKGGAVKFAVLEGSPNDLGKADFFVV